MAGLDRALSEISLLDDVVGTKVNDDGSVIIYVKTSVTAHYPQIVGCIRQHAPGTHGQVRLADDAMLRRQPAPVHSLLH